MLAALTVVPRRQTIGAYQTGSRSDVVWKSIWPFIVSNIVACMMIICVVIIGALEIASLAKGTSTSFYGNTSSTGAGFWCGFFFAIAAVLILLMNFMQRIRLWATIALIANSVAVCFAIILLGLDAKAVQDGSYGSVLYYDKTKVLAAQLAFAILEFLLCLIFIGIYIVVHILASRRIYRQQRGAVY